MSEGRRSAQDFPVDDSARRTETDEVPSAGVARRTVLAGLLAGAGAQLLGCDDGSRAAVERGVAPASVPQDGEDLFAFLDEQKGDFDLTLYRQLLGAANAYKEGDEAEGVAASSEAERRYARQLLARTQIGALVDHPVFEDSLFAFIQAAVDESVLEKLRPWTMGELKDFLLHSSDEEIRGILPGLPSDIIACVVKLMSNDELIAASRKIFNPLPGTQIGARGYMGARIQPNSPTDNVDDIRMQVLGGWAYGVGDVLLGTNPVSSEVDSVLAIEETLKDILETFGLEDVLPHCVLPA